MNYMSVKETRGTEASSSSARYFRVLVINPLRPTLGVGLPGGHVQGVATLF